MLREIKTADQNFSLAQARNIVRDLFTPNPRIYWTDFLGTILSGHICYGLVRNLPDLLAAPASLVISLQVCSFLASCLLYYRAALFIHELVHLPQEKFQAFRIVWNALCGIPFLIPSFVYYTHIDHHRRKHFGTPHDGEYMSLGRHGWWYIAYYLALSSIIPLATMVRFSIITPVTWLHPAIRRWVHQHASAMVMNPAYLRPLPTPETLRVIRCQEIICFGLSAGLIVVSLVVFKRWPVMFLLQAYCTGTVVVTLNAIRTLGAHRWWNAGHELTFVDQMLDSVTVADRPWISEIWGPVGTRYHSLHHLFPSMPYHCMPEAHRRLMEQLPAHSPYRQTVERSLSSSLVSLFRRSWQAGNGAEPIREMNRPPVENNVSAAA